MKQQRPKIRPQTVIWPVVKHIGDQLRSEEMFRGQKQIKEKKYWEGKQTYLSTKVMVVFI